MPTFIGEHGFSHAEPDRTGILLTNLGTPDAPSVSAVRRYLAEFLWDPRVIETPRVLWWVILHGFILRLRPARSARAYQSIWTEQGSPLLVALNDQATALRLVLNADPSVAVTVEIGMRYGNPSIESGLQRLRQAGARRILVLPLYPQYSATTTGATFDAVTRVLQTWRWLPEFRFITHYHADPDYIAALAASVREAWQHRNQPQRLLFSFHGIPQRYFLAGDPYFCHCQRTARLVAENLELAEAEWSVAFQSRVGRGEWLRPYTDEVLTRWGEAGIASVDVICPGFSADCLETLEEIDIRYRDIFLNAGGRAFNYVPALNAGPLHVSALKALVCAHLQGWETPPDAAALAARETHSAALSRVPDQSEDLLAARR